MCGTDVPVWPHVAVPQAGGSWLRYHEGCEPWRHPDVPPGERSSPIPERWRPALAWVVDRLVAGDYVGLAREGFVPHASGSDDTGIGYWIEQYPATLVSLPEEAWAGAERGRCVDDPDSWWVIVELWTAEEGRSDLSMEAIVREQDGELRISLDNVHVM
jgi:hypothetical protein